MRTVRKPPGKPLWKRKLRRRALSGLLVVVPVGLTLFVLRFLYVLTVGNLEPVVRALFGELPAFVAPAGSLLFLLAVVFGIGLATRVVLGRHAIRLVEAVLERIPLVKMVYGASKQIVNSLSLPSGDYAFQSVVIVDFPMPGMKAVAFVTGKVSLEDAHDGSRRDHYRVFIPTTPNPTSGYLEFVPVDSTEEAGISVEEAFKTVMSAGLVMPDSIGPALKPPDLEPQDKGHTA